MTKQPKVIKRNDKPVNPDVWRLATSMKSLLKTRYPNPDERRVVVQKIMQEVKAS